MISTAMPITIREAPYRRRYTFPILAVNSVASLLGPYEYASPGFAERLTVDGPLPAVYPVRRSRVIDEHSIGRRSIDWPFFNQHLLQEPGAVPFGG